VAYQPGEDRQHSEVFPGKEGGPVVDVRASEPLEMALRKRKHWIEHREDGKGVLWEQ